MTLRYTPNTVVFFNYTTMQLTAKIVYYGPGLCGKTTNLQYIHKKTAARSRGEMVSLETETDRTLFFDLLPLDVGVIAGMKVRLQLYTVPGQVFYNATRKLVLKSVDGVVFVADSQAVMEDANLESLHGDRAAESGIEGTDDVIADIGGGTCRQLDTHCGENGEQSDGNCTESWERPVHIRSIRQKALGDSVNLTTVPILRQRRFRGGEFVSFVYCWRLGHKPRLSVSRVPSEPRRRFA